MPKFKPSQPFLSNFAYKSNLCIFNSASSLSALFSLILLQNMIFYIEENQVFACICWQFLERNTKLTKVSISRSSLKKNQNCLKKIGI